MASTTNSKAPVYVSVSALDAGHLTLPERLFVTDADSKKRSTVPSLAFLIQHPSPSISTPGRDVINLVFDLGIKRDINGYKPAQREHVAQRQPVTTKPDCADSLRYGATGGGKDDALGSPLLDPARDIDFVVLSHVHWDHVGTASDFSDATFIVGSGTLDLLQNGAGPLYPAELFNDDELPASHTVELPPVKREGGREYNTGPHVPRHTETPANSRSKLPPASTTWAWEPLSGFPHALDLFGDASVYVIDSPGHLYGHVNVLARIGDRKYIYLGGDCCHDPRILSGEKGIALYEDGRGGLRSVHVDTGIAKGTLDRIDEFIKSDIGGIEVEVVVAHDGEWRERNKHRFWPGKL